MWRPSTPRSAVIMSCLPTQLNFCLSDTMWVCPHDPSPGPAHLPPPGHRASGCPQVGRPTFAACISPAGMSPVPAFKPLPSPLLHCAIEAMSSVTCSAVTAISHEALTVTQIPSSAASLQCYLAIYLLLLILCQKNMDVPLNM